VPPIPSATKPPALLPNPVTQYTPANLLNWGKMRAAAFCQANKLPSMQVVEVQPDDWHFDVCAYWRNSTCTICLKHCGRPAGDRDTRNWSWPGAVTDRTPYGVVCHELGHHVDWHCSPAKTRGPYHGMICQKIMEQSGEKAITSYCPNPAEWFAEMMRVFVTNHALLHAVRPKTWGLLADRWEPVSDVCWLKALGPGVPDRIIATQMKR
jgi:hypothetical protein